MTSRLSGSATTGSSKSNVDLRGSWKPEVYVLEDGSQHAVDGLIFFTERDWGILFFVAANGERIHGSGEAGTYTLEGDQIHFTHLYRLSVGKAVGALEEGARMKVDSPAQALTEPCRVERAADALTIHFGPSGNSMIFRRSSGL